MEKLVLLLNNNAKNVNIKTLIYEVRCYEKSYNEHFCNRPKSERTFLYNRPSAGKLVVYLQHLKDGRNKKYLILKSIYKYQARLF